MKRRPAALLAANLIVIVMGLTTLSSPCLAQAGDVIRRTPCNECTIELEPFVTLSDAQIPFKFTERMRLMWVRNLLFAVAPGHPGAVAVFDSTGRYLQQFGRPGEGPGEFGYVVDVAAARSDSIYVYDFRLRRISVLSSARGMFEYARSMPAPVGAAAMLVTPDGGFVMTGAVPSRASIGYPFHQFDADGKFVRSFGVDDPVLVPGEQHLVRRHVARRVGGGFWTTHVHRYVLELWSEGGQPLAYLEGGAPWLDPAAAPSPDPFVVGPSTSIAGLARGAGTHLWVIGRGRDPEWASHGRSPDNRVQITSDEQHRLYDTVVELLDTESQEVIASRRLDRYLRHVPGQPLLFTVDVEGDHVVIPIWRTTLRRGG